MYDTICQYLVIDGMGDDWRGISDGGKGVAVTFTVFDDSR